MSTGASPRRWLQRIGRLAGAMSAVACLGIGAASAQPAPIANVDGVNPNAFARFGGQQVTVVRGADLFEGQSIVTDAQGLVQIVFADDTRMVVGPNSQLVIERFLMRSPDTVGEFVANALGGTFRFLSGNSPSDAYRINTPGGTIGVRGTALDITIDNLLRQIFILLYPQGRGTAYHCIAGPGGTQQCTDLEESCGVLAISNPGNGWTVGAMPGYMFDWTVFPYATLQLQLLRPYRIRGAHQCLAGPEPEPEPEPEPDPCDIIIRQQPSCYDPG